MKTQLCFWLLQLLCISWLNAEPLVTISQGTLNGTIQESRNGRKYSAFLGIPFAEPPIGNLRFKNPVPTKKWDGVRLADAYGSICPQEKNLKMIGNEDCLYLNIYSPLLKYSSQTVINYNNIISSRDQVFLARLFGKSNKATNKTLLPVMVWIPGGAFFFGSSNIYGAGYLLDKDVLLVTLNYRLGILGFLSTGDSASPGNFGMKDQVLAMKWVQENIEAFGGDPKKVTLFGESAGGVSVALHALSKASDGLFQQYIIQSGSSLCPYAYQNRSQQRSYSKKLGALLLCPFHNSDDLVECLRKKSVDTLIRTSDIFGTISRFAQLTWTPTDEPDVDDAFLTDSPKNLIEQNQMKDLPFMTGQTTDEAKFITAVFYSSLLAYNAIRLNPASFISYLADYYLQPESVSSFTSAVDRYYFNDTLNTASKNEFIESFSRFVSDGFFIYPEVRMLEKAVPKMRNAAYFYSFGYRGSGSVTNVLTGDNRNVGVAHADDLLYLFSNFLVLFGGPEVNTTKIDESIIDLMVDLWTSFAINGKPISEKLLNPDLWAPYTAEKPNHLQIGDINNNIEPTVTLSDSYYTDRMNFWKEHIPL